MEDSIALLFWFVFWFAFWLVLVAVIGHGIWVLLAKIYRAIFSKPESQSVSINDSSATRTRHDARCAQCGAVLSDSDSFCPVCGRARLGAGPMADLATTARQLDEFLKQGKLDAEVHKVVMSLIEEERTRLNAPVRRDVTATRHEAKPQAPQPALVEAAPQQLQPALIEQNVLAVEKNVLRGARDLGEAAPASNEIPAPVAETPRQPRRSFTEMLETFMEESSIRWGELVGGLLIIGCSIALVVSLWAEIAARPFLKFSVFIGVTTALFGLGFYSAHRWKLPTTSRGVLIISTLLAPLNFLAMTAFSREAVPPSWPVVGGELFSLALFFFLVYQAAKVFLPEAPWMTALATMGPSLAMLLARHSSGAEDGVLRVALLGVAPLLCYCASCGHVLRLQTKGPKQDESDEGRADQMFTHLGIASFATLLPLGLLFIKPGYISQTLRQLAPLVSLFGVPAIAIGVALLQWPQENQSGKTRTVATSLSLIGSLISLAALIFAWPNAVAVVITAAINCAVCLAIALAASSQALRYDLRLAHAGAIAHLSLAFLIVANLFNQNVFWWSEDGLGLAVSFVSKTSGAALVLLFTLFAVASEWLLKKERKIESRIYGTSALIIGALGLLLITAHGFGRPGDPYHTAPAYAFYALAAFVIAWRREQVVASWIGSALSMLAIAQSLVFKFGQDLKLYHPGRLSCLVFANLAIVSAVVVTIKSERARRLFAEPFALSALIASVAVAPFLILEGWMSTAQISAGTLWLAGIWFAIAWLRRSPALFAAFQLALASSVVFATAHLFDHQWPHSFVWDLRTMQAQAVALAMLSLAWIAVRITLRKFGVASGDAESQKAQKDGEKAPYRLFDPGVAAKLLYPGWPRVDRVVTLSLLVFLVSLSLYGVHVGMVEALRPGWALSTESRSFAAAALGAGSWLLSLALSLIFIAGLWERFEKRVALVMLILLACACLLIAGRWGDDGLTPAIYRWSSAIAFAAVTFLIVARNRVAQWLKPFGWPQMEEMSAGLSSALRTLSLALFVAPVLIFSSLAFFNGIISGAEAALWPERSVVIAGLIAPLLLVGLSLVAHAIRERSAAYACAAGLMANLSVTFSYLLWASAQGWGIERADAYTVAQLNIITTSICSIIWIGFHRRQTELGSAWPQSEAFLKTQTGLALFLSLSALAVADARLFLDPWMSSALAHSFGGVIGMLAVALPMLAYARLHEIKLNSFRESHLGFVLIAVGSLLSCLASRFGDNDWIAFHTLALGLNASAWLMLALRWPARLLAPIANISNHRSLENWIMALAVAIFAMILRGVSSPGEPWWTVGFSISICLLFVGLSLVSLGRGYLYFAAPILNYAATRFYFWLDLELSNFFSDDYVYLPGVASLNAVVLALPAIAWLAIDLKLLRRNGEQEITPFHRVAARISLGLLSLTLLFQWLWRDSGGARLSGEALLDWFALASVVALFVACLWDDRSAYVLRGLHIIGLIAAGMALRSFNPSSEVLLVSMVAILSLYALATSALWRGRESLQRLAARLRMPASDEDLARFSSWLNAVNVLLGFAAYAITFFIVLNFESLSQRLIAATATIAIPISVALLLSVVRNQGLITGRSGEAENPRLITERESQTGNKQQISVVQQASDNKNSLDIIPTNPISPISPTGLIGLTTWMSLLSAVLWGWAWLSPFAESQEIDRMAVVMVATGAILLGYRFIISRNLAHENEWRRGVKAQLPIISVIGLVSLVAILGVEASNYALFKEARAPWWVVITVFAALVSLFCACIAFALSPGRDPFNLSERGRMNYVYGAEALTVVTVLHARVTMPWFFRGFFLTWWPLVVMVLAFIGVGLGEIFRRRGKLVLAEPLERTGILLPLLPVFGFWVMDSQVDYSSLLFLVGLFYGALSVMRRSFTFGIMAALAGNGGLWTLLDRSESYGFYQHPQLWLIPVSLSVLVAGHVNRDRLTKDQMTTIRYTTLMMIYVSSTSDIFINGVSESPWLTIILAVLSVVGVFAGLMLRIRAFLFLGTAFLLLSLLTIIWTALINLSRVWLWYVAGIVFGALIIFTFALFEKKRREMLGLVERLKHWQA